MSVGVDLKLAESEGEDFWLELLEALKNRGLRGVKLVVSDGGKAGCIGWTQGDKGNGRESILRRELADVSCTFCEGCAQESSKKEMERCSGVVGAFPNERSLIRLAVAILIDINEERLTGRRYLDMEESGL